jgi:protein translocase SecG subunit
VEQLLLMAHVIAAISLVAIILLQQGKGAAMGSAFGSGASSTVFGSRGSVSFVMKVTVGLVVIFFATSVSLSYLAAHQSKHKSAGIFGVPVEFSKKAEKVRQGNPQKSTTHTTSTKKQ